MIMGLRRDKFELLWGWVGRRWWEKVKAAERGVRGQKEWREKQISAPKELMNCPNCTNISTKQPLSSHEVTAKTPRRQNKEKWEILIKTCFHQQRGITAFHPRGDRPSWIAILEMLTKHAGYLIGQSVNTVVHHSDSNRWVWLKRFLPDPLAWVI